MALDAVDGDGYVRSDQDLRDLGSNEELESEQAKELISQQRELYKMLHPDVTDPPKLDLTHAGKLFDMLGREDEQLDELLSKAHHLIDDPVATAANTKRLEDMISNLWETRGVFENMQAQDKLQEVKARMAAQALAESALLKGDPQPHDGGRIAGVGSDIVGPTGRHKGKLTNNPGPGTAGGPQGNRRQSQFRPSTMTNTAGGEFTGGASSTATLRRSDSIRSQAQSHMSKRNSVVSGAKRRGEDGGTGLPGEDDHSSGSDVSLSEFGDDVRSVGKDGHSGSIRNLDKRRNSRRQSMLTKGDDPNQKQRFTRLPTLTDDNPPQEQASSGANTKKNARRPRNRLATFEELAAGVFQSDNNQQIDDIDNPEQNDGTKKDSSAKGVVATGRRMSYAGMIPIYTGDLTNPKFEEFHRSVEDEDQTKSDAKNLSKEAVSKSMMLEILKMKEQLMKALQKSANSPKQSNLTITSGDHEPKQSVPLLNAKRLALFSVNKAANKEYKILVRQALELEESSRVQEIKDKRLKVSERHSKGVQSSGRPVQVGSDPIHESTEITTSSKIPASRISRTSTNPKAALKAAIFTNHSLQAQLERFIVFWCKDMFGNEWLPLLLDDDIRAAYFSNKLDLKHTLLSSLLKNPSLATLLTDFIFQKIDSDDIDWSAPSQNSQTFAELRSSVSRFLVRFDARLVADRDLLREERRVKAMLPEMSVHRVAEDYAVVGVGFPKGLDGRLQPNLNTLVRKVRLGGQFRNARTYRQLGETSSGFGYSTNLVGSASTSGLKHLKDAKSTNLSAAVTPSSKFAGPAGVLNQTARQPKLFGGGSAAKLDQDLTSSKGFGNNLYAKVLCRVKAPPTANLAVLPSIKRMVAPSGYKLLEERFGLSSSAESLKKLRQSLQPLFVEEQRDLHTVAKNLRIFGRSIQGKSDLVWIAVGALLIAGGTSNSVPIESGLQTLESEMTETDESSSFDVYGRVKTHQSSEKHLLLKSENPQLLLKPGAANSLHSSNRRLQKQKKVDSPGKQTSTTEALLLPGELHYFQELLSTACKIRNRLISRLSSQTLESYVSNLAWVEYEEADERVFINFYNGQVVHGVLAESTIQMRDLYLRHYG